MLLTFSFKELSNSIFKSTNFKYQIINQVNEFSSENDCIILKGLNPDFFLLFGHLKLIITEKGSPLSHLAILAREHKLPILLAEDINDKIPHQGKLVIEGGKIKIEK